MKSKKKLLKGWKAFLWLAGIIVFFALFVYISSLWTEYKQSRIRYEAFGIEIPKNYFIHGIDVSHHQGVIDWPLLKEMEVEKVKINFAFIKATEGLVNVDRMFRRNWVNAGREKMVRGAYHFFIATKNGKKQAENFIAQVTLEPGDLPPVLDVEERYGVKPAELRKRVKEWLETIEAHYRVKPIIYTNVDFYDRYLGEEFDTYPLWVAHYLQPHKPRINRSWSFWQHSETGRANGIKPRVDFNVYNGDSLSFQQLLFQ